MKDRRAFKDHEKFDKPVVYVVGRGHSGTTVLDLALGQALGFRSTGELVSGLARVDTEVCTCGKEVFACSEWMEPCDRIFASREKFREYARTASGLARIRMLPKLPLILLSDRYMQTLEEEAGFLQALAEGRSGVIDSSKELVRGLLLALGPSNAYWVHIIRNPTDVINSTRNRARGGRPLKIYRRTFYPPQWLLPLLYLALGIIWFVWTTITFILGKSLLRGRYLCVVYEDFVNEPDGVAWNVAKLVGQKISREEIKQSIAGNIEVGHILGGNRMSKAGRFRVKKPEKRTASLGVRILTSWLYPFYRLFVFLK